MNIQQQHFVFETKNDLSFEQLRELYKLADGEESGFDRFTVNGLFNGIRFLSFHGEKRGESGFEDV